MKAKDTVIKSLTQIPDSLKDVPIIEAQADISFKKGMQEVVDWVNSNVSMSASDILAWQQFLKEHGL